MMTKTAHADLSAKLAPLDRRDGEAAFEYGFIKQAQAMGLNDQQVAATYDAAVRALQAPRG